MLQKSKVQWGKAFPSPKPRLGYPFQRGFHPRNAPFLVIRIIVFCKKWKKWAERLVFRAVL